MNGLMLACLFFPLLGMLLILLFGSSEQRISTISLWTSRVKGASVLSLLVAWAVAGFPAHELVWFDLYAQGGYRFPILFYLDRISAVYLFCAWLIFSIIVRYCRVYLHRETGYKRFFLTIFGFAFGLNLVILSGSIDMLFAGWEIVGVSSFLLIAFYRHRPQPIRNALRAYSIYRFCDVGLLLGAWMSHLLFHESQHFSQLANLFQHAAMPPAGYASLLVLSWLIVIAASGKSAQFPFCFWLPRAMEGPTPSSAIFYGALSIHLGVFLLLRTMPIWTYHYLPRTMVLVIGLLTVVIANLSEKTQSNIKGQVAYASITQVGFMFMELSLGLETLVLVHFLGNAFLRCYQLLVSPSIVAHLLRVEGSVDTDFVIKPSAMREFLPNSIRDTLPAVLQNTLYVFALQEGNLERLVRSTLWDPLKQIGARMNQVRPAFRYFSIVGLLGLIVLGENETWFDRGYLSIPISVAMVVASLSAFSQKHSPFKVWNAIATSCGLAGIAVWMMDPAVYGDVLLFLSGVLPSWLLGVLVLRRMLAQENFAEEPFRYRAMAETRPRASLLLFLSFLGLVGFPITPAFLGEDLLLADATRLHPWFALPITLAFVVNGIAAARVFVRLCMGRPSEVCSQAHESA
ncbi:proton-conducting transporter membrane subunit [Methylomonas sp. DH-1]|uniref:proton-conducting transporter transmembrane domain-containing protein n=1 Tax=Methylomonas sp. (strain DH-1) TaxID=1727196 RepID=UPI0007C8A9FA|nr:proton-conducting transporter membrane subunit [Methylomonas sp. DH-1]ANE56170.1 NADH-quinone oxidoreductase subunit E [Methylomonas sp. DH-1]